VAKVEGCVCGENNNTNLKISDEKWKFAGEKKKFIDLNQSCSPHMLHIAVAAQCMEANDIAP
jgi:hypothetical protein